MRSEHSDIHKKSVWQEAVGGCPVIIKKRVIECQKKAVSAYMAGSMYRKHS